MNKLTKRLNLRNLVVIAICLKSITVFALFSEEKEIESQEIILLLEEIQSSDGERSVYEYDNQNRITKYTIYGANGEPYWLSTYTYNAEGDLIEQEDNNFKITFTKNGNKITFVDEEGGYVEIELNNQELPVKDTYEWEWADESGKFWSKYTTNLTWQNRNPVKTEAEDEWKAGTETGLETSSVTYTYDDKKAPLYNCKTPKWFLWWDGYNINNNIKTWDNGTSVITYEYTYNDDGFPVTRKASNSSITDTYIYTLSATRGQ